MARVSVLIPTYKPNPEHLKQTLQSLMAQTEQDFECIICDEPTDSDTHAIVDEVVQSVATSHGSSLRDPRFSYHRNEKCLGIGGNWNRCLTYAKTPIIAFLFQDDLWERDYLKTGLDVFATHPSVGFISLNHRYRYDDNLHTIEGYEVLQKVKHDVLRPGEWKGMDFLKMWLGREMHPNLIGEPPFVMLRKEVMEEVGPFIETMPQFLDVEYWLRCLLVTDWYYADGLHGTFRVHGDGASFRNNMSGEGLYDRLTCFEMLINCFDGEMRRLAIQSRNKAVETMTKKYLMRVKRKQGVSKRGGGQVLRFVVLHPFLTAKSFVKVLWKRMTQEETKATF